MSANLNQPTKWHGGKNYIARDIVALMLPHLNYVEPFFGGGAVLFARDPEDQRLWLLPHKGVSEVVNDINDRLTNFWRVLQYDTPFQEFVRVMQAMPFSGQEFADAKGSLGWDCTNPQPCVRCAADFLVCNRQSLAGRMNGFTGITKTRTRARMNNEVSAWLSAVEGLPAVHERLKRVLILPPQDALAVIRKFDMPETLFYLDPPYCHNTRATTGDYAHEMTDIQHAELLDILRQCKGKVMLSGYRNAMYDERLAGWNRKDWSIANHAAGGVEKRRMTESLWTNY